MIWRGLGSHHAPHTPHLDTLLGQHLLAKGSLCERHIFGSTNLEQAKQYAVKGLVRIIPKPDTPVAWLEGVADVILSFSNYLSYTDWDTPLLKDIQGDVGIAEVYASYGHKPLIPVIEAYLAEHTLCEYPYKTAPLGTHQGEVWLSGPHSILEIPNG